MNKIENERITEVRQNLIEAMQTLCTYSAAAANEARKIEEYTAELEELTNDNKSKAH